jgi:epoxide hydrolase
VPRAVLDDLRERLERTRWPEQIPGSGWAYGTNLDELRALCEHWRTGYDWYAAQARLNAQPQLLEAVDDVDLHFLHVPGNGPDPFPLLLLHGWPGSVWEFMELLGPLSDPAAHGGDPADAFDLVVPSLPGFGFSGKPRVPGWGVTRIAAAFDELMRRLGYARYGAQGGDWGGIISAQLGADHPARCVAIHVNMPYAALPAHLPAELEDWRAAYLAYRDEEHAYAHVQRTKPDSLTVAQNDSPAGLAAWIIEKFWAWGDTGEGLERAFARDDLLTNLTLYWVTASAPSAARIYYEMRRDAHAQARPAVTVPTAVAAFAHEPFLLPRAVVEERYNVVRWTDLPRGGHFAALEQPAALIDEVRAFFRTIRG